MQDFAKKNIRDSYYTVDEMDSRNLLKSKDENTARGTLQPRQVTIHTKNGNFTAVRWISTETSAPIPTKKPSKIVADHIASKGKDASFESSVEAVLAHGNKTEQVRGLLDLGIYDRKVLMTLTGIDSPQQIRSIVVTALDVEHHPKTLAGAGQPKDDVYEGGEGGKKGDDDDSEEGEDAVPADILQKKRDELKKKWNITWKDAWKTYQNTMHGMLQMGYPKSLIAYGTGGLGKTFDLTSVFDENEIRWYDHELDQDETEYDAVKISGATGLRDMWKQIVKNKNKIIVFDDCDSMWQKGEFSPEVNILKGMLDTSGDGTVTYGNAGKDDEGEKLPTTIKFTGQVIFVSNMPKKAFPQPLLNNRAAAIDLTMTKDETLEKLDSIKDKVKMHGMEKVDGERTKVELKISKESRKASFEFLNEHKDLLTISTIQARSFAQMAVLHQTLVNRGEAKDFEKEAAKRMGII